MSEPDKLKLMEDLLHIGRMLRRKQHRCWENYPEREGPPPKARERVLRTIGKHPEGLNQNTIASEVGIRPQSLSELIGKLEGDGLIERRRNPQDKRETMIVLTRKGIERNEEVRKQQRQQAEEMFSTLSAEEVDSLRVMVDKILRTVDQMSEEEEL